MEEYDFAADDSGPAAELERKRRKRKKVRLWLGQPKRFDLVKKGTKDGGRKKKVQSTKRSNNDRQTIPAEMCTTEEAMAASILLQMSTHGGHPDQCEETQPLWTRNQSRHFNRPKGPSWIVDHDYAIQPQKYGNQKSEYHRRRSGMSKSKRSASGTVDTNKEAGSGMQIVEQASYSEQDFKKSEMQVNWRDNSTQSIAPQDCEETTNMWYSPDQLDSSLESDTILHLSENGEFIKLSQSKGPGVETSSMDVTTMFDCMKGDVEYKTVVITDDDDNILQNWNESIHFENYDNGTSSEVCRDKSNVEQLCSRCQQQFDPVEADNTEIRPSTSTSLETVPTYREQHRNAPDVIPIFAEQEKLQELALSEGAHHSVKEISNLSEDLVRNLENANMLDNFMVLFRTIAAGYVPDLSELDDLKSMKSGINNLPVGIITNV